MSRPPILQKVVYLGAWVADLTAYKIPVVENVGKRHNKVARTVFDDKLAIGGGARLASYFVREHQ